MKIRDGGATAVFLFILWAVVANVTGGNEINHGTGEAGAWGAQ